MTPGQILHTVDIVHTQNGFQFLKDPSIRNLFFTELNDLIADLDFTLFTALLDIPKAIAKWGLQQRTPYVYLMTLLLERIYYCIRSKGTVEVFAESRQKQLDILVESEFHRACAGATRIKPASLLQNLFPKGITFLPKNSNPGAELVDLLVTPIGRRYLGKSSLISEQIIDSKTYCRSNDGSLHGWGRIIQP